MSHTPFTIRDVPNYCTANCLQAHTDSSACQCECAGKNHGDWLRQYATWWRKQKPTKAKAI